MYFTSKCFPNPLNISLGKSKQGPGIPLFFKIWGISLPKKGNYTPLNMILDYMLTRDDVHLRDVPELLEDLHVALLDQVHLVQAAQRANQHQVIQLVRGKNGLLHWDIALDQTFLPRDRTDLLFSVRRLVKYLLHHYPVK